MRDDEGRGKEEKMRRLENRKIGDAMLAGIFFGM
jgi:hypothetical protein